MNVLEKFDMNETEDLTYNLDSLRKYVVLLKREVGKLVLENCLLKDELASVRNTVSTIQSIVESSD